MDNPAEYFSKHWKRRRLNLFLSTSFRPDDSFFLHIVHFFHTDILSLWASDKMSAVGQQCQK